MRKQTIMGPYEFIKEGPDSFWVSREKVLDGVVRIIDNNLCYAVNTTLELSEPIIDPRNYMETSTEKVVKWVPIFNWANNE